MFTSILNYFNICSCKFYKVTCTRIWKMYMVLCFSWLLRRLDEWLHEDYVFYFVMNDNEEILNLQTNKPNVVKLDELRKLSSNKSPIFRRKLVQNFILYVIDSIISLIFVAPMVIAFWRGTWGLLDIHIHLFPPYATGVFGIVIHMCFVLMRQFIQDLFEEENERAKRDTAFVISRRLYTYTYSVISVMQWRGCWTAFDYMFIEERSNALVWVVSATMVSIFSLITLKSLTNSLATPCILILDSLDACYNIPTRYRVRVSFYNYFFSYFRCYCYLYYAN